MLGLGLSRIKSGIVPALPEFVNASIQNDRGFHFDGASDFLSVADHDDFSFDAPSSGNPDSPFSWVGWVKQDGNGGADAILCKAATSATYEYRIFLSGGTLFADTYDLIASNYDRKQKSGVGSSSWYHLAITFSGAQGDWTFYKNGTALTGLTSGGSGGANRGDMENQTADFKVGTLRTSHTGFDFGGHMMQVILYNKELTAGEVSYLYASGAAHRDPLFQTTTYAAHNNVVAWWPLDDANGHEDHGNNGHDFTKNGDVDLHTSADAPF